MPNIDTLVEDIYHLLDEDTNHEASEENLEWIAEGFKQLLRDRLSRRDRKAGVLRFSSLGSPGRKLWYQAHNPDKAERMTPQTYMKFLYGDLIELLLLFLAKESGHDVQGLQREVEVDGVKGHLDAVIDGSVVDAKSASPIAFEKFRSGRFLTDDPFGYIKQISGYANCVAPDNRAAYFLAADKVHGGVCLAEVEKDVIARNTPGPRIAELRKVLESEHEPERCYPDVPEGASGNRKLGTQCSYCPFKMHCWRDSNGGTGLRTYQYAKGPVFLTHVAKEPRVNKIEPF